MRRTLLVTFAFLLGSVADAATPDITTVGAGSDNCRQWTEAINEPGTRYQYRQWLFGFVSGYNWRDTSKQISPPDSSAVVAWVDEYCKDNPDQPLSIAAGQLAKKMAKPQPAAGKR